MNDAGQQSLIGYSFFASHKVGSIEVSFCDAQVHAFGLVERVLCRQLSPSDLLVGIVRSLEFTAFKGLKDFLFFSIQLIVHG